MNVIKGIVINADTRIKTLLNADQDNVIKALIKLNKNFSKLKNPILRNLFAPRVSIADACKIANCNADDFLKSMEQIGFTLSVNNIPQPAKPRKGIDFTLEKTVVELDVRPFLENDQDPLKVIIQYANALGLTERLKIINTFEPTPLIDLLAQKGFSHTVDSISEDLVITWFEKNSTEQNSVLSILEESQTDARNFEQILKQYDQQKIKYVDVRELQMPQPMLTILDRLDSLLKEELLYVYHKKLPVFLIPALEERGLLYAYKRKSENELDLLIYQK